MAKDLRPMYTAVNEADAQVRLDEFHETWGEQYVAICALTTEHPISTSTAYRRLDQARAGGILD